MINKFCSKNLYNAERDLFNTIWKKSRMTEGIHTAKFCDYINRITFLYFQGFIF